MKQWSVKDAKARFSELVRICVSEGPQLITRRGAKAAVLVPIKDWRRMQGAGHRTLKELLLVDEARDGFPIPARRLRRRRSPPNLI